MSASVATQASTRVPCNLCGVDDVKMVHPAGAASQRDGPVQPLWADVCLPASRGPMSTGLRSGQTTRASTRSPPTPYVPTRKNARSAITGRHVRCWRAVTRNAATWSRSEAPWGSDWPPWRREVDHAQRRSR